MATWKEKGVVPDSDDEDDLDSQSFASQEHRNNGDRVDGIHGLEDVAEDENHGGDNSKGLHTNNNYEGLTGTDDVEELPEARKHISIAGSVASAVNDATFPPSSPNSPRAFKIPRLFLELEQDAADGNTVRESNHKDSGIPVHPNGGSYSTDEISKSYVQITSPTSSLLSSPPGSQPALPPITHLSNRLGAGSKDTHDPNHPGLGNIVLEDFEEPTVAKRSLRQRNLIQLYPFHMELEKYRRELKGRGIAPTMIAQSQEKRRRVSESSDAESQLLDTQGQGSEGGDSDTEESQPVDFSWDNPPISSVLRPAEDEDDSDILSRSLLVNSDDEFPDIDELLRERQIVPPRPGPKRRMKSYSTKSKPMLSKTQTHSPSGVHRRDTTSIFDIPASPPATSSPFPAPTISKPVSRATSTSSKPPTPSRLAFDGHNTRETTDLPTPATSAVKSVLGTVFIDSDSDSDDGGPFASDPNEAMSGVASSSSDESLQIRRVGKKIRGVLPASHLRLDQQRKKQIAPSQTHRESRSASPAKRLDRRGIALPIAPRDAQSPLEPNSTRFPFLEEDSASSDDGNGSNAFIIDTDSRSERESLFTQSRMGFAEEDDRIDAMLPSNKRQSKSSNNRPRKKRRIGSTSTRAIGELHQRQPKITEHLQMPRQSTTRGKASRRPERNGSTGRRKHGGSSCQPRAPPVPKLGILDVTDSRSHGDFPRFIRIAARTARAKRGQGRQSPSKKFIRLANREDTFDAQSVLQDWREGRIQPKNLEFPQGVFAQVPLQQIENNQQTRLRSPLRKVRSQARSQNTGHPGLPRKLVISNGAQRFMNDFMITQEPPSAILEHPPQGGFGPRKPPGDRKRHRYEAPLARPAQLESIEMEYSRRHPVASFRSTKKVLDTLYRASRKRTAPQANLQLSRFLADEDVVRPSVETSIANDIGDESGLKIKETKVAARAVQHKKRLPRRIDAGAAIYRQPSDPLILEFLAPAKVHNAESDGSKLLGLGKYGTNYPVNFDIFPLQYGVFFHESTFIGSGHLAKSMKETSHFHPGVIRPPTSLILGTKEFCWGLWDENVSSEVGLCFDWILDQISMQSPPPSSPQTIDALHVLDFVEVYVQDHISFTDPCALENFLSRMMEVLQDFLTRLKTYVMGEDCTQTRRHVEILEKCTLLALQFLQLSRTGPDQTSLAFELERLLQRVAADCISVLLSQGLEGIRKLYDDLQYLSFRERGIRSDQYIVQAWVIVIRVLAAAQIPRGSFWDVTNSLLMGANVKSTEDARIMEKLWYAMFSLLPLSEFDEFGVVIPGMRQRASTDNWSLPQQMLKRIFTLYGSNPRQSPSFNDYCRAVVSRCHYLMVEWGWWKCSGVIGILFDFFASQKLAHLRNEEAYASPHFLEELHVEPSLAVEPEDRCFHIFLKMVALGIKHLQQVGDVKSIRNLVARLLPNHDRQYPKEEAVHQRDLASLRNHHDLLCTLFWAAPPQQRPSPALIQELVVADRSHKEACLINVRAWENLARFVVTSLPTGESFLPFTTWQNTLFDKLWQQYLDTETEIRRQAESLSKNEMDVISESRIKEATAVNQQSTMYVLSTLIRIMNETISSDMPLCVARKIFNAERILRVLDRCSWDDMTRTTITILSKYISLLDARSIHSTEPESQDSLGIDDMERWEAIEELATRILPNFGRFLKDAVVSAQGSSSSAPFCQGVACWAGLVSLISKEGHMQLQSFVGDGDYNVFRYRQNSEESDLYWELFVHEFVLHNSLEDLNIRGFEIGHEWLRILTKPHTGSTDLSASLSARLHEKGYYLLQLPEGSVDKNVASYPREMVITWALSSMREIVQSPDVAKAKKCHLSTKEAQDIFSSQLNGMMESMKGYFERMPSGSTAHSKYVKFVQQVIAIIRAYGSEIRPVSDFFLLPSPKYWPENDDPTLFGAGIISYSLRLSGKYSRKSSAELFHYLWNGFLQALVHNRVKQHVSHLQKGMKNWEFTKFILSEVLPAMVHIGFTLPGGWVICATYLPVVASQVPKLLSRVDKNTAPTFEYAMNVLDVVMECMDSQQGTFASATHGLRPELEGILAVTFQFWLSLKPAMMAYSMAAPDLDVAMHRIENFFENMMVKVYNQKEFIPLPRVAYHSNGPENGYFFEAFTSILRQGISGNWVVSPQDEWVEIKGVSGRDTEKRVVLNRRSLREVLGSGSPFFKDDKEEGGSSPYLLGRFGCFLKKLTE